MCIFPRQHERYFKRYCSHWSKETTMIIIICHNTFKKTNSFLLCLHGLHTFFIPLRVYSLLLEEGHLGMEKCHRANSSQQHGSKGIQLLPNLTNIHWSSLGLFMVLWVKLGNEEHVKGGTRTDGQHKVLRKPMTKAAPWWLLSYVPYSHLKHFSLVHCSLCWPFPFSPPCCMPGSKSDRPLCLWSTSEHVGLNNFQPLLSIPSRTVLCSTGHIHFPWRQMLKRIRSEEECIRLLLPHQACPHLRLFSQGSATRTKGT